MGNWIGMVDVSKSWKLFNWQTDFKASLERVISELKESTYYTDGSHFKILVNDLATAENVNDFNALWDELYNYCDHVKIWVKTTF